MERFQLFADPWWVNLLIFAPFFAYFIFRKKKLKISRKQLSASFIFGIAFGFVEAAVVVYLRTAIGMLSPSVAPAQIAGSLSMNLLFIEIFREAATIVMLLAIAFLAVDAVRERWAIFLWTFATWDIFYYVFLWTVLRWPSSFTTTDILFLIPTPWYAQIWFPILIDALMMVSIALVI